MKVGSISISIVGEFRDLRINWLAWQISNVFRKLKVTPKFPELRSAELSHQHAGKYEKHKQMWPQPEARMWLVCCFNDTLMKVVLGIIMVVRAAVEVVTGMVRSETG